MKYYPIDNILQIISAFNFNLVPFTFKNDTIFEGLKEHNIGINIYVIGKKQTINRIRMLHIKILACM